ncbi:hypothetical protein E6H34_00280 [Candidatus Bathyarchaeota archaeon]|nr:MAG: hypothetical protein E6H34_00280 [Candidatus Bathyarchaeota archaeon]
MKNLPVDNDYVDYFMGHTVDTYHDNQSKGIEHLRSIYAPGETRNHTTTQIHTQRDVGENGQVHSLRPWNVLNREALSEPHRIHATRQQREEEDTRPLTRAFVDYVIEQVNKAKTSPGGEIHRYDGGAGGI